MPGFVWAFIAINLVCLAFFASVVLTTFIRDLAHRYQFVDQPDGRRKVHKKPVALGGGVAIWLAAVIALAVSILMPTRFQAIFFDGDKALWLLGLFAATAVLCGVGLVDDKVHMRGRNKLLGQIAAISILLYTDFGLIVQNISFFNQEFNLGVLAIPFTVCWLLMAINSLNLIDGIDGLAGSIGVIFGISLGVIGLMRGFYVEAAVAFSLAGALLGFLRFNFPPATIYMGDAGSMVVGLVMGVIAIRCAFKGAATAALAVPLAIWAIPILDSVAAMMRRKLTGRSIYATDRGHLHHVLLNRGFSVGQTLAWIIVLCVGTAIGALLATYLDNEWIAILNVAAVVCVLVAARIFGHVEATLLKSHLRYLFRRGGVQERAAYETSVQLQGSREWKTIWAALTESAERFNLASIKLNLHLPQMHEGYYASWKRQEKGEAEQLWRTELPITLDGQVIGRLEVTGLPDSGSVSLDVTQYLDFFEPFEASLRAIISAQSEQAEKADTIVAEPRPVEPSAPAFEPQTAMAAAAREL